MGNTFSLVSISLLSSSMLGAYTDSESSKVSPTHPGLDIGTTYNDQWTALEDVTTEPEMSTEQSEHSGDHSVPEDGGIKNKENGEDCCNDGEDLITVASGEKHKNREEGSAPGTDPSSHRNAGSNNGRKKSFLGWWWWFNHSKSIADDANTIYFALLELFA